MEDNFSNINSEFELPEQETKPLWSYPPKKAYIRMGLGILAFIILFNFLATIGQLAYIAHQAANNHTSFDGVDIDVKAIVMINFVAEALIAAPVFWFIIKKLPTIIPEKKKMGFGGFLSCVCMMYAISIGGAFIGQLVNSFLSSSAGVTSTSGIDTLFEYDFIWMAVFSVLTAPIIEELVFRKFIIDKVQVYSQKYAIILSGLTFGLMHGNFEQFFYTFFIGMLFAFIYVRTGKLRYTIALHFILNGISTVLMLLMSQIDIFNDLTNLTDDAQLFEALLNDERQLIFFILVAFLSFAEYILAFIGLILFIVKNKRFVVEKREYDADAKTAFLNYGVILAIVAMIGLIIWQMYM